MQNAMSAAVHRGCMPVWHVKAMTSRLHAIDLYVLLVEERVKQPDRVGASANASNERIWQPPFAL